MTQHLHKAMLTREADGVFLQRHARGETRYVVAERTFWLEASQLEVFQEYEKKPGQENDPDELKFIVKGVARLEGRDVICVVGNDDAPTSAIPVVITGWTEAARNSRLKLLQSQLKRIPSLTETHGGLPQEILPNVALSYDKFKTRNHVGLEWRAEIKLSSEIFAQLVAALIDGSVRGLSLGIKFKNMLAHASQVTHGDAGFCWYIGSVDQSPPTAWGLVSTYSLKRSAARFASE